MAKQEKTSWESSAKWYDDAVGERGHYYHETVILPHLLKAMEIEKNPKGQLLDLACGQGILARSLPPSMGYVGVDLAKSLIAAAKERSKVSTHQFLVHDVTTPLPLPKAFFSHAAIVLALQNIENPLKVIQNVAIHLSNRGRFFIVLNHPCFRIPRQSHWGVDEDKKLQYRRIDTYLSSLKIPIQTHPGKKDSIETYSFHHPLSAYTRWLREGGFAIIDMEEWISNKESSGGRARMENRARQQFPLFLLLICEKIGKSC